MGAGRKTQTITVPDKSLPPLTVNSIDTARNLRSNDLAGVIFGCKHNTIKGCFANELFGLPAPHFVYVRNINPGLPLFLFNYSDRKLHGIFEAVSPGRLNINPQAWTEDGSDWTPYPAQVKFRTRIHCQPLLESQFGPVIADNYYGPKLFWFELDQDQTSKLFLLFSSSPMKQKQIYQHNASFGSNARKKQQLDAPSNENGEKQGCEVVCMNSSSGHSYTSVLKNKSSSVIHTNQSYIKSGTSSQKPWSALFNKEIASDAKSRTGDSKMLTSESDLSYLDQSNLQWEPSPYITEKVHVLETPLDKEHSGNCGTVNIEDSSQEAKDQDGWQWTSSCVSPSFDEESQPSKVPKHGDLPEKEHLCADLDCECSLYESMANMVITEDNQGKAAEVNSRMVFESQSSDFCSVVSKLLFEVEELKKSQSMQVQKTDLLEQELIASRIEIQQLKDRCKMSKSNCLNFGELMLIAGGFDGSLWFSSLDAYSPFQDLNVPLPSMSSARSHASAVNSNGQLYVFGGVHGNYCYDTVESYNPTRNKWVSHPPLNQRKGHLAGVSLDNKIFAIGGGHGADTFAEVEMLDVNAERWIPVRSMLEKRLAPAAAELSGVVYVVGGYDGTDFLNSVERLDSREHSWRKLKSMASRRGFHSLAVLNDKLYALGGYDGHGMLSSVELFDPRLGSWMTERSMSDSRGYFGAFVLRNAIYIMGGLGDNGKVLDTVDCYKESCGWQVTNLKGIGKRCFFSGVVL